MIFCFVKLHSRLKKKFYLLISDRFSSFADTIEQSKGECTSWSSYLKQSVDIHFTLLGCITRAALCDSVITSFSQSFLINCNSDSLPSLLQHLAASRTIGVSFDTKC